MVPGKIDYRKNEKEENGKVQGKREVLGKTVFWEKRGCSGKNDYKKVSNL